MRRKDAEKWALKMEQRVDRGESVSKNLPDDLSTFAQLIDLHIADMPAAEEAIALFVYRIVRECGSHISALGGIDALVFTGGVGENSCRVRAGISSGLAWAGIKIDTDANAKGVTLLSPPGSAASVFVLLADEESEIARDCLALL